MTVSSPRLGLRSVHRRPARHLLLIADSMRVSPSAPACENVTRADLFAKAAAHDVVELLRVTDGADALYDAWNSIGITTDPKTGSRLQGPPVETDYGMREFALVDPSGNLIRVGSPPFA